MKLTLILLAMFVAIGSSFFISACTEKLEVNCVDDIVAAYPICEKAAQEKGKDTPVDLQCMKYFVSIKADCWPCICKVAKDHNWNIKGC